MALDLFKNFAKVQVSAGYDASATSIVLSGGHGTKLPAPPFNATWWNSTDFADPTDDPNVEIVRVTAVATDTLTVTRGQEATSASTKNTASKTYRMIAGVSAKTLNEDLIMAMSQSSSGRLTLETGVPISLGGQVAKTTIYFTPYNGNRIGLYSGTSWNFYNFAELSLPLGTLTANKNYDVFVYLNAGALTLEFSAAWTTDIARADALILQDGVFVKSGDLTRRYLGTFRTTTTTTTEDSITKRFVWNNMNRVVRDLFIDEDASHTYTGNYRQWNGNVANQIEIISGLAEDALIVSGIAEFSGNPSTFTAFGVGLDSSIAVYRRLQVYGYEIAIGQSCGTGIAAQIGYHAILALQSTFSVGTGTFSRFAMAAQHRC